MFYQLMYIVSSLSQKHASPRANEFLLYSSSLALVHITVKQAKHLEVFRDSENYMHFNLLEFFLSLFEINLNKCIIILVYVKSSTVLFWIIVTHFS